MELTPCGDVEFLRLVSDESTASALSEESCSYHQTDIFTQLPSSKSLRRRTGKREPVGVAEEAERQKEEGEEEEEEEESHWPIATREWDAKQPLRSLPLSMTEKRVTRDARQQQHSSINCWESWKRSQRTSRRRLQENLAEALWSLQLWRSTLHRIEGKFGSGVKSYFTFLRYLVYLNMMHCLITGGLLVVPVLLFGRGNETLFQRPEPCNTDDSFLDVFSGSGILGRSALFYGFYRRGTLDTACLNIPLFFLLNIFVILFVSLVFVVRRMVNSYKMKWMLADRYKVTTCYKMFCGWDFCIQDASSASLKQSSFLNDLKVDLEEEKFLQQVSRRTVKQWALIYVVRVVLNLVVLILLSGAFTFIYFATKVSQKPQEDKSWIFNLVLQYLPSITITLVNFLLPHMFRGIAKFEEYSLTVQVNITLCWENVFGQEMYKLMMFDFLACIGHTFLTGYTRKYLVEKCSWRLVQKIGKPQFLIPLNVLDIVYNQTVTWVGLFYTPLMPLLLVLKLIIMFYLKKFYLFSTCEPARRMFRPSSSSVLFHFMLLLGLLMSLTTLAIHFHRFQPSDVCGPFQGSLQVLNVVATCLNSLPTIAKNVLFYLMSEAFAIPLLLTEIILLTSYISLATANRKTMERLKDRLVLESFDKRYLVKNLSAVDKKKRKNQKGHTSAMSRADVPWKDHIDPLELQPGLSRGVSVEMGVESNTSPPESCH
ncbi:transmembrane channel-like protein 7 isoform X2 [Amia ocellicauda]|uniref:transmembrane channel-like protein 7 isoform X2 n=1 Tax=Amia ocellicauda TaxID=2972642 RepID=UPI003463E989